MINYRSRPDAAEEAAEKIRLAIQNTSFDLSGLPVSSTVSIGISGYPVDSTNTDVLLDCADKALYESKRGGRNCVTLYSDLEKR